jgi:hypothetical protein
VVVPPGVARFDVGARELLEQVVVGENAIYILRAGGEIRFGLQAVAVFLALDFDDTQVGGIGRPRQKEQQETQRCRSPPLRATTLAGTASRSSGAASRIVVVVTMTEGSA